MRLFDCIKIKFTFFHNGKRTWLNDNNVDLEANPQKTVQLSIINEPPTIDQMSPVWFLHFGFMNKLNHLISMYEARVQQPEKIE